MRRFAGMTLPVANLLIESVFCILDNPTDDPQRISAHEFGVWVRDLPTLMGASQLATHTQGQKEGQAARDDYRRQERARTDKQAPSRASTPCALQAGCGSKHGVSFFDATAKTTSLRPAQTAQTFRNLLMHL
ncbi:hypothetical protein BJV78DRAFT_467960 [Lactifluus subvellereus]|nr:hypothetical protein BJV78DRAFT_467960 [Lactifluus subvellereus]